MNRQLGTISFAILVVTFVGAPGLPVLALTAAGQAQLEKPESEFRRLAGQLAQQRLGDAPENEKLQEQALTILDSMVLATVNAPGDPDLEGLNQRLTALAAQQPMGEGYRVVRLSGSSPVYALVANFGLGGPSAVRLYRGVVGRHALAARIDRFAQKDFFDEYLELVPIPASVTLFVTVVGRADELQTGAFTLWHFEGNRVQAVWASDILPLSSYEYRADGFRLTYCVETDEENPRLCRRMTRDRYVWEGAAWKRVEQANVPVPKR